MRVTKVAYPYGGLKLNQQRLIVMIKRSHESGLPLRGTETEEFWTCDMIFPLVTKVAYPYGGLKQESISEELDSKICHESGLPLRGTETCIHKGYLSCRRRHESGLPLRGTET